MDARPGGCRHVSQIWQRRTGIQPRHAQGSQRLLVAKVVYGLALLVAATIIPSRFARGGLDRRARLVAGAVGARNLVEAAILGKRPLTRSPPQPRSTRPTRRACSSSPSPDPTDADSQPPAQSRRDCSPPPPSRQHCGGQDSGPATDEPSGSHMARPAARPRMRYSQATVIIRPPTPENSRTSEIPPRS